MSQAGNLNNTGVLPPGTVVETLTGNTGGPVGPDGSNNINVIGDGVGITIVGNPGTNTLVASLIGGGDAAETFITDSGTATPSGGVINVITNNSANHAGSSVLFSGSGNTVELHVTDGNNNTIIGLSAGNLTLTGSENTVLGTSSAAALTSGTLNTIMGYEAGVVLTTGTHNTLLGFNAGTNYSSSESNNILIHSGGVTTESNVLRIGTGTGTGTGQLNESFISGIHGITPGTADGIPVFIGSAGQLGTVGSGGSTFIQTVTGNTGGAVPPSAGNINIVGDGTTIEITGNPGTNTLTVVGLGGGGGTLTQLSGDTGFALPTAGIIDVITNNAAQAAGSTVLFSGATNKITLKVTDSDANTLIGNLAGNSSITGVSNTGVGEGVANLLTTGSSNVMLGESAGSSLLTGSNNILLGTSSGSNYASSEANNIILGSIGTAAESNTLRIGSATGTGLRQLNKSFISGIRGITPATTDGIPVFIGSAGQLGTVGNGGTTMIQTVTGNTGGAVGPLAGNINIVGDGTTIEITGNPGTNTLTVVGLGGGGGTLTQLSGDVGFALPTAGIINVTTDNIAQGAGSTVLFTGSGNSLVFDTTDSNGNTLVGGDTGKSGITGTHNIALGTNCGSSLTSGGSNMFFGYQAGNLITTGSGNFLCGDGSLNAVLQGTTTSSGLYGFGASSGVLFLHNWGGATSTNTFVGLGSGSSFSGGQQSATRNNTACGVSSLASLTTAVNNAALGTNAGRNITSGNFNALIGNNAGFSYTTAESNNIVINAIGTVGESNTLRMGAGTGTGPAQLNRSFISGIRGIAPSAGNGIPVFIDTNGQLGTVGGPGTSIISTLTGNTGGAVGPNAGNINVRGDGTSINVVGNPGTNTLTISSVGAGGGPSFIAYFSNNFTLISNTLTTLVYDTVPFNQGGAYNAANGVFTAPITGMYNFSCNVYLVIGTPTRNLGVLQLVTSRRNFQAINPIQLVSTSTYSAFSIGNNFYCNLNAGDTAFITMIYNNGGLNTTIQGNTTTPPSTVQGINTFFSGMLV